MTSKNRNSLFALSAAAAAFLLAFVLLSRISLYNFWDEQQEHASQTLGRMSAAYTEVRSALAELNQLELPPCSPPHLTAMRKVLFSSVFIKDLGYFSGKELRCTTGLGELDTPYQEPNSPDVITPGRHEIWLNQKLIMFDKEETAILVRSGQYNAVVNSRLLGKLNKGEMNWKVSYLTSSEQRLFLSGDEALPPPESHPLFISLLLNQAPVKELCDNDRHLCLSYQVTDLPISKRMHGDYELVAIGAIMAGIAAWFFTLSRLALYQSPSRRVKRAVAGFDFYCVYQPIVELTTGRVIGVEMLARHKGRHTTYTPDEFIPVIANEGLSWAFTRKIATRAFEELNTIPDLSADFRLSLNIFPQDISSTAISKFDQIEGFTQFKGQVVLEVIENEELDKTKVQKQLTRLQEENVQIAIDDFGTGYSNLNQLRKIKANTLKIDRSFVMEADEQSIRSSLISHIVNIARQEKMAVVAEGIETKAQHLALLSMGVEFGQGWAFGRPMPLEELKLWLAEQHKNR